MGMVFMMMIMAIVIMMTMMRPTKMKCLIR